MPVSISGTNGVTFPDSSLQAAAASPYTLKNKIINGDFRIDQRNAGASGSAGGYTVDRWAYFQTVGSKGSWQQNAGAVTPPAGFTNYWGFTSSSAYSVGSGDLFVIRQFIEGYNVADLSFGTASAKTVTISFWVRSSLTGTFGGSLLSGTEARSYPFTYTISSANTWEQKTITIAGDTTGTWATNNTAGMELAFGLGAGSTYSGTAGAWASASAFTATGATSVVGTNGATFYITGVQLEQNTSATPFERRLYNQELANCQRYYETTSFTSATFNQSATRTSVISSANNNVGSNNCNFVVTKRAAPTVTLFSRNNTSGQVSLVSSGADFAGSATANQINAMGFSNIVLANNASAGALIEAGYTASAEL